MSIKSSTFFDNLEPIDYSWAFFFFIRMFFLSKKFLEIQILALAFAAGSRLNFLVFAFAIIFLLDFDKKISINRKVNKLSLCIYNFRAFLFANLVS